MSGSCINPMNWGDCLSDAAGDMGMSVVQSIIDWCIDMAGKVAAAVTTWWIKVPTGNIVQSNQDNGPIQWVWAHTLWITTWIAVMSILFAAGRLAIQRRAEPAVDVAKGLFTMTVTTSMALGAIGMLTEAGDQFSSWIVNQATDQDFGRAVVGWLTVASENQGGPILALILALLATLACLAQVALMLVRTAMLILLCGTLPLTAAASSTPSGRQTFQKTVSWLIAFLLYKPVAAIIYATAFRMIASLKTDPDSGGLVTSVAGIVLMLLSVVALPALMRFITPVVGAAGGGGGGGGGAAAMGALASGAKSVGGSRSGSGGGGGGSARSGRGSGGGGSNPSGSRPVPAQGGSSQGAQAPAQGAARQAAEGAAQGQQGAAQQGASQGQQGAAQQGASQGAASQGAAAQGAATQGATQAGAAGAAKAHPAVAAAQAAQQAHSAIKQTTENTANAGNNGGPSGSA
ncbi:hypothetical protein ACIRD3_37625 [Kitasatospora sp. NPDC093550]|uniref:hypothetical protein n=1 Tax=Kitasatospora sp. NPDC093550 TaxID=3364089 RepID=UPI003814470B